MVRYLLSISLFFCVATQLLCQSKSLNEDVWQENISGTDYIESGYKREIVEKSTNESVDFDDLKSGEEVRQSEKENTASKRRSQSSNTSIPSWLSTFMMVLVIGLLLFFIVSTILKNPNALNKKVTLQNSFSEEDLENIESNPFENDLERFIHEAKESGNYKLAVRFSFIYIIRLLAENGSIQWKKDKTNHQYYSELSGNDFQGSFYYMKLIYETIWYGDVFLNEQKLINSLTLFENHISSLKQTKRAS